MMHPGQTPEQIPRPPSLNDPPDPHRCRGFTLWPLVNLITILHREEYGSLPFSATYALASWLVKISTPASRFLLPASYNSRMSCDWLTIPRRRSYLFEICSRCLLPSRTMNLHVRTLTAKSSKVWLYEDYSCWCSHRETSSTNSLGISSNLYRMLLLIIISSTFFLALPPLLFSQK